MFCEPCFAIGRMSMMKKNVLFLLLFLWGIVGFVNAQSSGCVITLSPVPPNICVGNTICLTPIIEPPGCISTNQLFTEVSQIVGSSGVGSFSPASIRVPGLCVTIPLTFPKGRYCVRVTGPGQTLPSDVRCLDIDTIDPSPGPTFQLVQLPPIRPSYCPNDTVRFKVTGINNAGFGYTIQWIKNGNTLNGATDSTFSVTTLTDGDYVSVRVTKQNKCALNATTQADSINIKVNKNPKVTVLLKPGSTGCEKAVNSFVARLDSAGVDPTVIWTRVTNGRIDTLQQGINDTLFTLTPADSSLFGDQICAEVITARCLLKAKNCYTIRACGEVFIDPPLIPEVCAGTEINVPYTLIGSFTSNNIFRVQLSDENGSFTSPLQIGTLLSNRPDTIRAMIPGNLAGGNCFKVRILSSAPADTSDTSACIKVYPRPSAPVPAHDSVCKSGVVELSVSSPTSNLTFNWYTAPFGGTSIFTGTTKTLFINRDTVFYVSSISANGCESDRVPVRGVINPSPNVEAGPDRSVCSGVPSISLNPFPTNGTWTGPLTVSNNVVSLTGALAGDYKLYYSVTNALGCSTTDSLIVRIKPIPVVSAGPDFSVCTNNQPIILTATPAGGIWSGNNIQADGSYQPSIASPGTDVLVYSFTQDGCTGTDTVLVDVRQAPPIFDVITTNPTACNVDDGTATLSGITTGPGFKVKWSVDRADSLSDPSISNLGAGAYTVVVTDLTTGCIRRGSFGLSDPLAPPPVITGLNATYCSADTCSTLSVTPNSPSGTWSGTGLVFGPGNSVRFCPSQANLGPNTIVYTYDTTGGCTGTTSLIARVNASPVVNAGGPADTACSDAGTFQLEGFSPAAPPAIWSPQPLVSQTGLVNPAVGVIGNNVLTLTRTLAGCSASATRNLFIYEKPNPVITRNPLNDVCQGQSVVLTAGFAGTVNAIRFEWYKNNIIIPNENTNTITVTESGDYSVVVTGAGECPGASQPVTINFNPIPSNGVSPSGILTPCSNSLTTLTADSSAGYSFQWFEQADPIAGQTLRTFTPSVSGLYRVLITNSFGCTSLSSIVSVDILPAPQAPIISPPFSDTCLQAGQPITITVGASGSGLSFEWYKVGTPDVLIPGQNDPVLDTIKVPGSYYVRVLASNGCQTRSDTMNILPTIPIVLADTLIQKCLGDNQFVVSGFLPNNGLLTYNGTALPGRLWDPNQEGDFTLTYQVSNTNGCISRKNLTIRVNPLPPANLVVLGPTNVCQGDSVRLIVNNGTETGCAYQLIRNGVDFGLPFTTPFVFVKQPGNYQVLVTCSRCSTLSNTLPVTFKRLPRAEAGQPVSGCSPLVLNMNSRPNVTAGTWSGSPRVVTSGNYNSALFTGCELLTLTVDSSNGCSNTDTVRVCVDTIPDFTVSTLNASGCQAIDGAAWVNADTSSYRVSWIKVGAPSIVLSTSDSLKNVSPGAYQVTISVKSTNCSRTYPALINSPNNLDVSFAGLPDSICANGILVTLLGIPADSGVFTSFGNRIVQNNRFNPALPGPLVDTVYYTATLNGCVGTAKKSIKINPVPVVDAGPLEEVCLGDTLILRAVQPVGVPLIWIGSLVQNDSLFVANDENITTAQVLFGYTRNGCSATASKTIRINSLPEFNVVPTNVTSCGACNGSATREIVNSAQYQTIWRNLVNNSIIGTGTTITDRCVGPYSCEVIQITSGCKKKEFFAISGPTNIDPFVCLQNVPDGICQNAPSVTIGKCKPSATIFIGGFQTDVLNPSTFFPGPTNILLSYTDTNGCTGVEQKTVEIKDVPTVNVAGVGPLFGCTSQTQVQLTGFFPAFDPSVPENGWSVVGSAPAGFITRDGRINPSVVPNDAVFTLRYNAKFAEPNGCSAFKTIQFRVYKTPVATIIPNQTTLTICNGTSTLLSSLNTGPGLTYTWFLGNQANPPSIGFGPTLSASLPGVYRLQLNNQGCRSELSGVLVLQTTPAPIIANIGSDLILCQSAVPTLLDPPSVSGQTTTQFWEPVAPTPTGFVTPGGQVNTTSVSPGSYQIRFVASNGSCSDSAVRTITVIPNIDSEIAGDQTVEICEGQSYALTANATDPSYHYEWLRGGVAIPNSDSATIHVTLPGEYRVRILVNNIGICATPSNDFVVLSVKPSPVVVYSGADSLNICYPSAPVDLNTIRPYTPVDAQWTGPGTLVTVGGLLRPDNIPSDGIYILTLSKTIGNCSSSKTLKIKAFRTPDSQFSSSAQTICADDTIHLKYSNPNGYLTTWLWDNNVVATGVDSIQVTQAGNYTLEVNNNGCSANFSQAFSVNPNPTFGLPGNTEACKNGDPLQFFPINPSPGLGAWSGPGISATGGWDPKSADVPSSGPVTISYTRTSEFGCSVTKSFEILVNPVPEIGLTTDKSTIEVFGPAVLTASGGVTYQWEPSSSLSAGSGPQVLAKPAESTTYKVTVTTNKGCVGDKSIDIIVDQEFKIYDGFSPNADQKNDVWIIKNIQRYPAAQVKIYNRWGNLVFESEKGYPTPWDGTFDGNPVPPGAYYYIIDLGQGLTAKSGSITVVR